MSQRHRFQEAARRRRWTCEPTPTTSGTASTASCSASRSQVSSGSEPEDVHEPGRAWVRHRHDAEKAQGHARPSRAASAIGS